MNVVEQYKNKDIIFSKIDLERMHRNITCKKNNCYINGGECASTTDIKYALEKERQKQIIGFTPKNKERSNLI